MGLEIRFLQNDNVLLWIRFWWTRKLGSKKVESRKFYVGRQSGCSLSYSIDAWHVEKRSAMASVRPGVFVVVVVTIGPTYALMTRIVCQSCFPTKVCVLAVSTLASISWNRMIWSRVLWSVDWRGLCFSITKGMEMTSENIYGTCIQVRCRL